MTIPAINSVKTNNINFTSNNENSTKENSKNKMLKGAVTTAGLAAVGLTAYKKNWVPKAIKWLSETKFMKNKVFKNYEMDNVTFMSLLGVISIVLKDGLGCYLYVTQSLNNKEIPEDKRKFVAALDLTNGGLMIATQLLAFFTVSNKKVQQKIFNKVFGKNFTRSAGKALQAKLKQNEALKGMTGDDFHKGREDYRKGLLKGFGYLLTLVSSSIFAKRVVVPFIATPLADKAEAWMNKDSKPSKTHPETKNTYNTEKNVSTDTKFEGKNIEDNSVKSTNLLDAIKNKAN